MLYSLTYLVWTIIYYVLGGTDNDGNPYIYSSLNWQNPQSSATLAFIIIMLAVPAIYTVFVVVFYAVWPRSTRTLQIKPIEPA